MKKIYSNLIFIFIFSFLLIIIFYLSSTINSTIKIAARDLEVDYFIKKEVELSRQDLKDYKINANSFINTNIT